MEPDCSSFRKMIEYTKKILEKDQDWWKMENLSNSVVNFYLNGRVWNSYGNIQDDN